MMASGPHFRTMGSRVMPPRRAVAPLPPSPPSTVWNRRGSKASSMHGSIGSALLSRLGVGWRQTASLAWLSRVAMPRDVSASETKCARSLSNGTTEYPSENMCVTAKYRSAPSSPPLPKGASTARKGGSKLPRPAQSASSASVEEAECDSTESGSGASGPASTGKALARGQACSKLHLVQRLSVRTAAWRKRVTMRFRKPAEGASAGGAAPARQSSKAVKACCVAPKSGYGSRSWVRSAAWRSTSCLSARRNAVSRSGRRRRRIHWHLECHIIPQVANSRRAVAASARLAQAFGGSSCNRAISSKRAPSVAARFKESRGNRLPASRRNALVIFVCLRESRPASDSVGEPKLMPAARSTMRHSRVFCSLVGATAPGLMSATSEDQDVVRCRTRGRSTSSSAAADRLLVADVEDFGSRTMHRSTAGRFRPRPPSLPLVAAAPPLPLASLAGLWHMTHTQMPEDLWARPFAVQRWQREHCRCNL
mmetsp:Transcript_74266/g.191600  ORF Transcript_74266/g.191600 Transcript_74266/m.191600 type:complete len:481 (+) Transcript_74266:677-2119(+)